MTVILEGVDSNTPGGYPVLTDFSSGDPTTNATFLAYGVGTRAYGAASRNAVTGASVAFALPALSTLREILVNSNTRCFLNTGIGTGVTVAPGSGIPLAADEKFHFQVPAGHTHIAVIQDTAGGFLTIVPVVVAAVA